MLNEKNFIDGVWDKYEDYSHRKNKDKFFTKHLYKNTDYTLTIKMLSTFLVIIITTFGIVYAGVVTYNNIIQKQTKTDFTKGDGYDYNQDMIYQNNFYYKKITSYEEYLACSQRWENLVEMKQEDFEEYFIVITAVENYSMLGLYISNVTSDETTLYIEFSKYQQDEDYYDTENTVTSTKIPINLNRDNIVLKKVEENPNISQDKKIEELPIDYSKEQAIADNCFVIENSKVISSNKQQLEDFIENSEKGINTSIRIVAYFNSIGLNTVQIDDIEYKDGKYIQYMDDTRGETGKIYHNSGNKIKVSKGKTGTMYQLEDEIGNKKMICVINHD